MVKRVPTQDIDQAHQLHLFYNGLSLNTRLQVNATAGAFLLLKDVEECFEFLNNMAKSLELNGKRAPRKSSGLYEVDKDTSLQA